MNDRIIAQATALGLAALVTLSLLAGVDSLAVDQHAAIAMAASAPAHTAAAKAPAKRS
jgi:hypothetical protein